MQDYQRQFIEFMVRCEVLTFGDFTAKSGRKTPYFINAGRYRTGAQLSRLARSYAQLLHDRLGREFDVLFGPAYKGIPLAVSTSMVLASEYGHDVGFCFNRKEAKDHGEGGSLVGAALRDGDRVVLIEDVTTAGTSVRETVPLMQAVAKVKLSALIVGVDRMERGQGDKSALAELRESYGLQTLAIVTVEDIMEYLRGRAIDGKVVLDEPTYERMREYRRQYGGT